jgi:hypothetical protein
MGEVENGKLFFNRYEFQVRKKKKFWRWMVEIVAS